MEHAIAVGLEHFSMRVEAGVAAFCDSLSEKLHSIGGVTEDDGLVDL